MADTTTIYTPENNVPHNGFGSGNWSDLIPLMFIWGIFGGGNGFGFGGQNGAAMASMAHNNQDLIMQAINGNGNAISELSTRLDVSISAVQQSLNAVSLGIQQVGNQVGMSGMQVINAIQAGNADLGNRFASCCCEVKNAITTQGYENRLATLQQTDALSARIADLGTMVNDKFCELEKRELQGKIDALAQQNTILRGTIDNANQTAAIQAFVGQSITPVANGLSELSKEVTSIKACLPSAITIPYSPVTGVPTAALYAGVLGAGIGANNGFFGV